MPFVFDRLTSMVDFPELARVVSFFSVEEVHGLQNRSTLLAGPEQSLGNLSASVSRLIALGVPPNKIVPVFEWYVSA